MTSIDQKPTKYYEIDEKTKEIALIMEQNKMADYDIQEFKSNFYYRNNQLKMLYEKIKKEIEELNSEISKILVKLNRYNVDLNLYNVDLNLYNAELKKNKGMLNGIFKKKQTQELNTKIRNLEFQINSIKSDIERNEDELEKIETYNTTHYENLRKIENYKEWYKSISMIKKEEIGLKEILKLSTDHRPYNVGDETYLEENVVYDKNPNNQSKITAINSYTEEEKLENYGTTTKKMYEYANDKKISEDKNIFKVVSVDILKNLKIPTIDYSLVDTSKITKITRKLKSDYNGYPYATFEVLIEDQTDPIILDGDGRRFDKRFFVNKWLYYDAYSGGRRRTNKRTMRRRKNKKIQRIKSRKQ